MTEISTAVPNDVADYLRDCAAGHGITLNELLKRSLIAYTSLSLGAAKTRRKLTPLEPGWEPETSPLLKVN
jgi:hypothetical protein